MTKAQTSTRKTTQKAPRATKLPAPATAPLTTPPSTLKPPRQTKAALLRTRLAEAGGASLTALMEMTGWQAHTLRAAITGLRKAGLTITRRREGKDTIYAIEADATQPTAVGGEDDNTAIIATDAAPVTATPGSTA